MDRRRFLCCSLGMAILLGWAGVNAQDAAARLEGEPAPTFRAKDILPESVTNGQYFTLRDQVPVRDYLYDFVIESSLGTFPALGTEMLKVRASEAAVLARAGQLREQNDVLRSAFRSIEKTTDGVQDILSDPEGTVLRTPPGLARMLRRGIDRVDVFDKTRDHAGGDTRRRLAVELGVDPETTNPALRKLLGEVALKRELVDLLVQNGIAYVVPGFGLIGFTEEIKRTLGEKTPMELSREMDRDLETMGVETYVRRKFLSSPSYTTSYRLQIVEPLKRMPNVGSRQALIETALEAPSEPVALCVVREAAMLEEIDKSKGIKALEMFAGLVMATLKDGRVVFPVAADDIYNTKEFEHDVKAFAARKGKARAILWVTGRASDQARRTVDANGFALVEKAGPLP